MSPALSHLAVAAAFWILIHLGVAASPLRARLIGAIGALPYRGLFSTLSAIGLGALIWTFGPASRPDEVVQLRPVALWMLWSPAVVMPFALALLIGSLTTPNPTMVQGEAILKNADPAKGIMRVTRHPMLWSFALWALAHLIANGDAAGLLLFGSVLIVALNGMTSIDRKRAASDPEAWALYAGATSILPFAAIIAGRNRFVFREIGFGRIGLALLLWIALVLAHPWAIGLPAVPA